MYMHIWSLEVSLDCKEWLSVKVVMKEWACIADGTFFGVEFGFEC